MDTAIIVGVVIGSVVAMALVFGKTVLSVAWTGNDIKKAHGRTKRKQEQNCARALTRKE